MTSVYSRRRGEGYERLVRQEKLILDVTERLTEALLEKGVTKAELARRLGRTPGFVSQLLGGGRNLTLRTISDIAAALSLRPALELRDRAPVTVPVQEMRQDRPRWTPPPRMAASPSSTPPPAASVRHLPHQAAAA